MIRLVFVLENIFVFGFLCKKFLFVRDVILLLFKFDCVLLYLGFW